MDISESKRCYNVIPSVHYFYIKTNKLADFQICTDVPLKNAISRISKTVQLKLSPFTVINSFLFTKSSKFHLRLAVLKKVWILRYPNNCPQGKSPPVRFRVWVRFRISFRVGGQFSSGLIVLELDSKAVVILNSK